MFDQLPGRILDFVREEKVGHLSVRTQKGVLVHPIAYYCDNEGIVFGTPRGSAKLKILKKNPRVSFTVDNGKLMKEAIGITVVGKAVTYSFKSLITSTYSALRSSFGFMKKYPELLKFYVGDMSELPDDRKFYKYVFVRINPTRIIHWDGYEFGRIASRTKKKKKEVEAPETRPQEDPVVFAKYVMDYYNSLESIDSEVDEDLDVEQIAGDLYTDDVYRTVAKEKTMDVTTLLSLPEPLRKTGLSVLKLERGSLNEIAADTGFELRDAKNYLDRLALMKMLKKKKEGDQLIYYSR